MNNLRILFIGNSHTYFHDLPALVKESAKRAGDECEVTMLAHGGWFLAQHVSGPEARFNIMHGNYDYVVLQEHSHPFPEEDKYFDAVRTLAAWIKDAGSRAVIYATWAKKKEPEMQAYMNRLHEEIAGETGALLAAVGQKWWDYQAMNPDVELYDKDGAHASVAGSDFAAGQIWNTIEKDLNRFAEDKDRNLQEEGFSQGDIVAITFEDGEQWEKGIVVDNGFGKLVIRNMENEFAIAYVEREDKITLIEKA